MGILMSGCSDDSTADIRSARVSFTLETRESERLGTLAVNERAGEVCYELNRSFKAAHLHLRDEQTLTDDVIATLFEPGRRSPRSGCETGIESRDLSHFLDHSTEYFVDLHLNPQKRIVVELVEA
jgi:hypothetical protein